MRYVSRALLAGGLGLAAAFLAACGASSGLLSASQASNLTALLNRASADVSSGQCYAADKAIGQLRTQIAALPGSVNTTLVSDLSKGAKTVEELANDQCGSAVGTGSDTKSTTTATTAPSHTTSTSTTTTTTTTPTETTPSPPTPAPTTPSTPATTPSTPGTTSTGASGGGAPTGGGGGDGQGNNQGNGQGVGPGG
jgi:hypothetical protein